MPYLHSVHFLATVEKIFHTVPDVREYTLLKLRSRYDTVLTSRLLEAAKRQGCERNHNRYAAKEDVAPYLGMLDGCCCCCCCCWSLLVLVIHASGVLYAFVEEEYGAHSCCCA
jgi:hypothetical protein